MEYKKNKTDVSLCRGNFSHDLVKDNTQHLLSTLSINSSYKHILTIYINSSNIKTTL